MDCGDGLKIGTLLPPTDSNFTQNVEAKLVTVDKAVPNEGGSSA
jgi:hypothetical protein